MRRDDWFHLLIILQNLLLMFVYSIDNNEIIEGKHNSLYFEFISCLIKHKVSNLLKNRYLK